MIRSFGSSWNSLKGLSCTNRKKINVSARGSRTPTHSLYQTHDSFSQWGSFIFYLNIWMEVKQWMHAIIDCRFVADILRRMLWLGSKTQVEISRQVKVSGIHKANSLFWPKSDLSSLGMERSIFKLYCCIFAFVRDINKLTYIMKDIYIFLMQFLSIILEAFYVCLAWGLLSGKILWIIWGNYLALFSSVPCMAYRWRHYPDPSTHPRPSLHWTFISPMFNCKTW